MVSMSRKEVLEKINDFSILIALMKKYSSEKIGSLYKNIYINNKSDLTHINEEDLETDFNSMISVNYFLLLIKLFCYNEEYYYNLVNNYSLDFSELKRNVKDGGIFLNGDGKNFSDKQIILYIRNAFSHNTDESHSKFNFSKNGRYLEIYLKDVRKKNDIINNPNPKVEFHVKISLKQLYHYFVSFNLDSRVNYFQPFINTYLLRQNKNLDKINFIKLRFFKELPSDFFCEIDNYLKRNKITIDEHIKNVIKCLNKFDIKYELKNYEFDKYQQKAFNLFTKVFNNTLNFAKEEQYIDLIIGNFIPLGMENTRFIEGNMNLIKLMDLNSSLSDINESVRKITFSDKNLNKKEEKILQSLSTKSEKYLFYLFMISELDRFTTMNLLFYYFNNFSLDNLTIKKYYNLENSIKENDTYSIKDHLRNALTHGWFFLNLKNELEIYDNINRYSDNYKFYYHATIPLVDLMENILETTIYKQEENQKVIVKK